MPLPLIAGAAGGLLGTLGSIFSHNQAPMAPNARHQARSTAQARDLYGGRTYRQDYEDATRYAALNQSLQELGLFGSQGGTQTVSYQQQIPGTNRFRTVTKEVPINQTPGLLDLLGRAAPEVGKLKSANDPQGAHLLDLLTSGAEELNDPNYRDVTRDKKVVDASRAAWGARGLSYSPASVLDELLGLDRDSEDRRMARGAYGANIAGARRNWYGDPLSEALRLIGAGGQSVGGPAVRNSLIDPQVAHANQNSFDANIANYNSMWNNIGGSLSGGASLGASLANGR